MAFHWTSLHNNPSDYRLLTTKTTFCIAEKRKKSKARVSETAKSGNYAKSKNKAKAKKH